MRKTSEDACGVAGKICKIHWTVGISIVGRRVFNNWPLERSVDDESNPQEVPENPAQSA
jgi:hypothetical protein